MSLVPRMKKLVGMALLSPLWLVVVACGGGGGAGVDGGGDGDGGARVDARPMSDGGGGDLGHPFGTHGGYFGVGVAFPSNHTPTELDDATAAFYEQWKGAYLEPGCVPGQYRVNTSSATAAHSVSEGHGYGMLVTVLLAGRDAEARQYFDGLYAYYAAHPSSGNVDLMAWAQDAACQNVDGGDSATDGDLDIAYALLLADAQWGSGGGIDYRGEALEVIAAVLASDVHPTANSVLVGDWATAGDSHHGGTRPSDFMPSHFKSFGAAVGGVGTADRARWAAVADKTYVLVAALQDGFSGGSGLLPDFAVNVTGAMPMAMAMPAPADWLEGGNDGKYAWNACRTPWRLATDYLMSGDARSQVAVQRMNAWVRMATGDDPTVIEDGYELDGQAFGGGTGEMAFVAPFAVSAMVEPAAGGGTNVVWLNALWDAMAGAGMGDYYGDSIKLLAMLVVSGNWWVPAP